jgi:3-oxoacyl-[acyl-carrier protein] reductase
MNLNLNDRVALVCAASKGLGRGAAMALAREGADLVICARGAEALEGTAEQIRAETGVDVLPVPCDLNGADEAQRLVERALAAFGRVDILVSNIAHPKMGGFSTLSEEDWRRVSKSQGILDRLLNLPNAAFVSVESACLAQ